MNPKDDKGKDTNLNLYGATENGIHRRLDLVYYPCTHKQETDENKKKRVKLEKTYKKDENGEETSEFDIDITGEECVVDLKDPKDVAARKAEFFKYLGFSTLTYLTNKSFFDLNNFGEETTIRQA